MKLATILLVFILNFITINAQQNSEFEFDFAQFAYDTTSNYIEFYYSIDQHKFLHKSNSNGYFYNTKLKIQIQNIKTGELIVNKQWKLTNSVKNDSNKNSKILVGVLAFILPSGKYDLNVSIEDLVNPDFKKDYNEKLNIVPFIGDDFKISDIQLASNIKQFNINKESIFYKNNLEVIPNPAIIYSLSNPVLFFYSEIYNLKNNQNQEDLTLKEIIFNSNNIKIYERKKRIPRKSNSILELGAINLLKYPTDTYLLVLALVDSTTKREVVSSKKFFLYNPKVAALQQKEDKNKEYISSEFAVYTEKECDRLFDQSKYIASPFEIEQYEKLDSLNAKREFLYKFWKKRDPVPETEQNEYKNEYLKRIEFCNARFHTFRKEGYKTDRGRIYLQYGPPDRIDRYPNELNMKPYEIWQYQSIEGGVIFVFGDITGYADYELLHSTKRGELRDDNWTRRIRAR